MNGFLKALRDGDWLTQERARVYPRLFAFMFLLVACGIVLASLSGRDPSGRPLGTDFLNVYAAGTMVAQGRAAEAYDWPAQHAVEKEIMKGDTPFYGWHYPPPFLAVAAVLAKFPYVPAFLAYMAASFCFCYWALKRLAPEIINNVAMLAGFAGSLINFLHGQNGFLTAGLLAAGLSFLESRPWMAGIFFGLLVYKPHYFAMIPVVLLAARSWRAFIGSVLTAGFMAVLSTLLFGPEIWGAFFRSTELTRTIVLEQGNTGWEKIQTLFSIARKSGASLSVAYALQALFSGAAVLSAGYVWARSPSLALRGSVLSAGLLVASPYVLDYDLMILCVSLVLMVRLGMCDGFRRYEKTCLAVLWIWPLIARIMGSLFVPMTPFLLAFFIYITLKRAQKHSHVTHDDDFSY